MSNIQLQTTYQDVTIALGMPLGETNDKGFRILSYTSEAPVEADYYFLKGDKVALKSISYYTKPKNFAEYTAVNGTPSYSVQKSKPDTPDPLKLTVHVWPEKGLVVTTIGSTTTSDVIREDIFTPITLREYLSSFGSYLVGNAPATITQPVVTTPTVTKIVTHSSGPPVYVLFGGVVLSIFLLGVLVVILMRRKMPSSMPPSVPIAPPSPLPPEFPVPVVPPIPVVGSGSSVPMTSPTPTAIEQAQSQT